LPLLEQILKNLQAGGLEGAASTFTPDKLILDGAREFAIGGPEGDNGLSGKKLVIDHYGPGVPIGGGALCGKDPHKVDKCGALRARQLAKRLVRKGVDEARVILGWAPGGDAPFLIVDTRTGVDDKDYQVPFRFTGKLDKLTVKLGPPQLAAAGHKVIEEAVARAKD
jgi:S-adenosylmethionine synthetase